MNVKTRTQTLRNQRRRVKRRRAESRLGASAVEFAIVANVMFVMILACMEFARMNMVRNLAQDAAYFAARQAIVPGATATEAEGEASQILDSILAGGYTVSVSDVGADSEDVTVTVDVDLTAVALFAPYFLTDTTLSATARMRTERYEGFYQQ